MRILWFVNNVFPDALGRDKVKEYRCWWLVTLADRLKAQPGLHLTIATASHLVDRVETREVDGIRYVVYPESRWAKQLRTFGLMNWDNLLEECAKTVREEAPDVVVVHGTEYGYGLVASRTDTPVIVSLQGILNPYHPHYWGEMKGSLRRFRYLSSLMGDLFYRRRLPVEAAVIRSNGFFLGRTDWDRAHMRSFNPQGRYFHEDRIIRPAFVAASWDIGRIRRGQIYTTTTPAFLKGTPCLLEALANVRRTHPWVTLVIGGPIGTKDVGGYVRRRVTELGLSDAVTFVGYVGESEIVRIAMESHLYVIPSYIENSPNNLAEAQCMGMPCVASFAGGIPSMVSHGETGLLFNVGDAAVLAENIRKVVDDDALAVRLSANAKRVACARHDPGRVMDAHLHACRSAAATRARG